LIVYEDLRIQLSKQFEDGSFLESLKRGHNRGLLQIARKLKLSPNNELALDLIEHGVEGLEEAQAKRLEAHIRKHCKESQNRSELRSKGYVYRQALETGIINEYPHLKANPKPNHTKRVIHNPTGRVFLSSAEASREFGLSDRTVAQRIRRGCSEFSFL
jgi:ribosomal protein S15P/S13E